MHPHRPVAIQIECLTGREAIAFPIQLTFTLRHVERSQRVGQKISITQVREIARLVFGHTLQVLDACRSLQLRLRCH